MYFLVLRTYSVVHSSGRVDLELSICTMWSEKTRLIAELDRHNVLAWALARSYDGRFDRNRLFWKISSDGNFEDDLLLAAEQVQGIATIATEIYVGRTSLPCLRMFAHNLRHGSTMVPHALRFSHMVVLLCDTTARILEAEVVLIRKTWHFLAHSKLNCSIKNRSSGLDGPVLGKYQFLYVCFNSKWAQGHDVDAEQNMLNSLFSHTLAHLDAEFVEEILAECKQTGVGDMVGIADMRN